MKNKLSVFAALCALFALVFASPAAVAGCRAGLRLCIDLILPSLFPFFVLSALLVRLGLPETLGALLSAPARRLFGISGAGATAFVMGLLGGYPTGAAYLAELTESGAVEPREAGRLLAFCNNSGPAFFLGALGTGVFGSVRIGLLLYAVHITAALLTGLLFRAEPDGAEPPPSRSAGPVPLSRAIPAAVRQAVSASLNVCGFVVCFAVFTGLLDAGGLLSLLAGRLSALLGKELGWCRALLVGFFELGGGIGALPRGPVRPADLALAAGLMGWGGLSVHFQTLALLADTEIQGAPHTAGRLVNALFSYVLAWGLGMLLK